MSTGPRNIKSPFNLLVVVAALGYFVDIYDLILFNVVKKESLLALGLAGAESESNEIFLFNCQMAGMLIGGILWGVLGDKRGRLSVLFGSILMYSIANIANAFVTDIDSYAIVRFIAGLGLAGELGAGVTLVVESMSRESRGYGTMLIVSFGALGAVFASAVGKEGAVLAGWLNGWAGTSFVGWQMAYIVGGVLGLFLLVMRVGALESGMFMEHKKSKEFHGNIFRFLSKKHLLKKYIACILMGIPVWYIIGILVALCGPIAEELGISGIVMPVVIMYTYLGLAAGDFISGFISQLSGTRRRVIIAFLILSMVSAVVFLFPFNRSIEWFNFMCFFLGLVTGYWTLFVTMSSESFGTNIRSTVTNTVPNFVRGSVIPMTLMYKWLTTGFSGHLSQPHVVAAICVGVVVFGISFWGILQLKDTFTKDLNYSETL